MKDKKIKKAAELLWLMGIVLVAFGVAICSMTDLGVSMIAAPAFILQEFLVRFWDGLTVGVVEYIFQGLLLILMCLLVRRFRWRYLLAFLCAVLYGYVLNFFLWVLRDVRIDSAAARWGMLLLGDTVTAAGVACFFRTYLPLQVYELFVAELSKHRHFSINKTKAVFDYSLLAISVLMALLLFRDAGSFPWRSIGTQCFHSLGLGTVVTTLINSLLITVIGRGLDRSFERTPRFPRAAELLGEAEE